MSTVPTPITDKNGKQTTVHKKVVVDTPSRVTHAGAPSADVSGGNINPATGQAYPIRLNNVDVENAMRSFYENLIFTGLHTEVDEDGNEGETTELDMLGFTVSSFSEEAQAKAEQKVLGFIADNPELVSEALSREGYDIDSFANDLGYTLNGHGTGFWDRDPLAADGLGDKLTEAASKSGGITVYVGDDGALHL